MNKLIPDRGVDAREIGRAVNTRQVLRALGLRCRSLKRADCNLCRGRSIGTIAYTDRLWHCHRCHAGGDVFSLVQAVNRCEFVEALRFLADLAGIHLEQIHTKGFRRELAARKRVRDRIEAAAEKLAKTEHRLLRHCRSRIHDLERERLKVSERLAQLCRGTCEQFSGESENLWATLQAISTQLSTELALYSLLAFGTEEVRARIVLRPEEREQCISNALSTGFLEGPKGKVVEVLQ